MKERWNKQTNKKTAEQDKLITFSTIKYLR